MRGIRAFCALVVWAALSGAAAEVYELAVDVPATLGGVDYTPNQVIRKLDGAYQAYVTLPATVAISALHRQSDGDLLFAPATTVTLGESNFETRDVVRGDGTTYTYVIDGSAVGIAENARVDALMVDPTGDLVMSFDIPVLLGGVDYAPSSLVKWTGQFSTYWDGPMAGVPAASNVVGADRTPDGALVLSFDIPTKLGGIDYLPGQLVRWQNSLFSLYASDAAWPPYAQLRDFSLLPPAGDIPDGHGGGSSPMRVAKSGPAAVVLTWDRSCASTDTDYAVYEGTLGGSFNSHEPRVCTTGGATTAPLTPQPGDRYFLVVPRNAESEGSYGVATGGERPAASAACLPQQTGACL
jgi:hypothetical protein